MAKPCERCNGTGVYRRGSFTGFCYTCKGKGSVVRTRRPSVARIEQRLANLQDEKNRLAETLAQDSLEYETLTLETEQFFAPVRETLGVPPSLEEAMVCLDSALRTKREAIVAGNRRLRRLGVLGPLTRGQRETVVATLGELENDVATLEAFALSLPQMESRLLRKAELRDRLRRMEKIDRETERLQNELASTDRQTEVKIQKLAARVALSDRENRETVLRFRSELPKTERCPYCGEVIVEFHLDHIVPVSYGGRPCRENLVWVCAVCNLKKSDLTLLEFAERFKLEYLAIVQRLRALGKRA